MGLGRSVELRSGARARGCPAPVRLPLACADIETAEFATVSRERSFAAGERLVGRVWRSATPIWIVDATTESEFLRAPAAAQAGLHGGGIFPILLDTEARGVIEFFGRPARESDAE